MERHADLVRFYGILGLLEESLDGKRLLADCNGRMIWPGRGVYFVFEPGETRSDTGGAPRVVRVGTHALKAGARTSLRQRLSQHRGTATTGGGNHRCSIFRGLVGSAIKNRDELNEPLSWGVGIDPGAAAQSLGLTREQLLIGERSLETAVSQHIRRMSILWLSVNDTAGPESDRGAIERNAIGLLSNYGRQAIDPPSTGWLGNRCDRERVRKSGLWNNNHVDEGHDCQFLDLMERHVDKMIRAGKQSLGCVCGGSKMKQSLTTQELKAAGFEFADTWGPPNVLGSRAPVPPPNLPGGQVTYVFVINGTAVFAGESSKGLHERMDNWRTNSKSDSCYGHLQQAVKAGEQVDIWYQHGKRLGMLKHQFAKPEWSRQWPRD
jgi:hypothetical protein